MVSTNVEPPFPVVQLTDADGSRHLYRLIRLQSLDGKFVLYDLSCDQNQRRQDLILPEQASISPMMRETMIVVPDTVSHRTMTAQRIWEAECRAADREMRAPNRALYPPQLVGKNFKGWEDAKRALRGIIGSRDDLNEKLCRRGMDALILDPRFRDEVLREEAEKVGVDKAELKRIFFRWIRFGGDAVALMPRRGGDAPLGTPRTPRDTALRVGRRDAKELRCGGPRTTKGMTARWRARIWAVAVTIVREASDAAGKINIESAISFLKNRSYFWEQFRQHFYAEEVSDEELANRPTQSMVFYHWERMINKNEPGIRQALLAMNDPKRLAPIPGGAAVDRNADILETIEMDATEFRKVQIVAVSSRGVRRQLGYATLILACSRSTAAIVGWYVMIGRELSDAYRKCLYWTLADKAPILRWLGLDPAQYPGIISGSSDEALVDRGPGSAESMVRFTIDSAKMDLSMTRPYTAEDKGTVENANSLVKGKLGEAAGQTKKKILASQQLEERILSQYKALPHGYIKMKRALARQCRANAKRRSRDERKDDGEAPVRASGRSVEMDMRSFVRMVVEAVNALNLQVRTDELARTRDMIVERTPPTRADMHHVRQANRFGDAARPANLHRLALDVLTFSKFEVQQGKVRRNNVWYGAGSEGYGEELPGVRRLLEDAKAWADSRPGVPFEIEVAFPPDPTRLVVFWKRRGAGAGEESQFELLELPATNKSLRTYGHDDGEEVARALSRCRREDQTSREKFAPNPVDKSDSNGDDNENEEAGQENGRDARNRGSGKAAQPRTAVTESEPLRRHIGPDTDYASPPMEGCSSGGKSFDLDAWLDSLRAK
ncbi:hypothetical protein AU476_18245 [Cupriavidus sp. UYMSc13B]|nr:hypothetical protein AU476_18245 [Cupriavidus sp. UYMSc13B]